jgi:asparagine synthase (glutamine-hydrolysing)
MRYRALIAFLLEESIFLLKDIRNRNVCGITGVAYIDNPFRPDIVKLRNMCDSISHRGPDSEGIYISDGVGMGMRRLAVIDVVGGSQPVYNETGDVIVVYNGEIYNFKALRKELEAAGHIFKTNSDTEVIVHAYEAYGRDFPKYFDGMFAISLYDKRLDQLHLVRDHIGIKPLYYWMDNKSIVWGSEIKAILASGLVPANLHAEQIGNFLAWDYVPGRETLFRGVRKVLPATICSVERKTGSFTETEYWNIEHSATKHATEDEWIEILDDTISRNVRQQLISDVPLGVLLSGGVDSSLVTAFMGQARAFSIGYEDPDYNELPWANDVARHFGAEHTTDIVNPDAILLIDKLMYHMDDPIGDYSIFPTYQVSALARKNVTVALSGDGGDELFGGYETYNAQILSNRIPGLFFRNSPARAALRHGHAVFRKSSPIYRIGRLAGGFEHSDKLFHARWRKAAEDDHILSIFAPDLSKNLPQTFDSHILSLFGRADHMDPINRCLYVDLKSYLCDNILTKVDRMSMAVSLEARVPLLSREVVETAFSIPGNVKIKGLRSKYILKKLASRYVPKPIIYRKKRGFTVPIREWINTGLRPFVDATLDRKRIRGQGIFNSDVIDTILSEHRSRQRQHGHIIWNLIIFELWAAKWLSI